MRLRRFDTGSKLSDFDGSWRKIRQNLTTKFVKFVNRHFWWGSAIRQHRRERRNGEEELGTAGDEPTRVHAPTRESTRIGHDTSLFSKLVLGCIDSYDSEKWRIFSHFSRSTRFSRFGTAPNSKFQENSSFLSKSCEFSEILQILLKFREKVNEIC